jgi:hypothetical protein
MATVIVEKRPDSDVRNVVAVFRTGEGRLRDVIKTIHHVAIRNESYSTGNVHTIGCFPSSSFPFGSTKVLDGGRQVRVLLEGVSPHVGEAVLSVIERGGWRKRGTKIRGILSEIGVPRGVNSIIQTMAGRAVSLESAYFPSKHRKWWV